MNLTQAIEQLKREIQKENSELTAKDSALKTAEAEKVKYNEIIAKDSVEVKKIESQILTLTRSIQEAKVKIPEIERNIRKLTEEIAKIRRDQQQKNEEIKKAQNEYDVAVRSSKNNSQR